MSDADKRPATTGRDASGPDAPGPESTRAEAGQLMAATAEAAPSISGRRLRRLLRDVLWTRKISGLGALIVAVLVLAAIFAPVIAPKDPNKQYFLQRHVAPSTEFLLGTDTYGRDILSRLIWGARSSLLIALGVVTVATVVGGTVGIVAGYVGGTVDRVLNFGIELMIAVPLLLLALALLAMLGPGLFNVMLAIGLGSIPIFGRVLRAETRSVREREFVTAARAVGASHVRIILKYILPNVSATLIILATTRTATAVLTEASLSFLGVGIQPPTASWGVMVAEGRTFLDLYPWISIFPGIIIMIAVLSFNLLGDGLRDALDVRLRHEHD